jgi:hypothetical protein
VLKRLVDELAMQRRDVLSLHVASDPSLALDVLVFTLADADTTDWKNKAASTLRGGVPNGPIIGLNPLMLRLVQAWPSFGPVSMKAGAPVTARCPVRPFPQSR